MKYFKLVFLAVTINCLAQKGEIPYVVPATYNETEYKFVYVLKNNNENLYLLKLYNTAHFELNRYFNNSEILCEHYTGKYEIKKGKIYFHPKNKSAILKKDTLIYATPEHRIEEGSLTELNDLNGKFFSHGTFYKNELNVLFKKNPLYTPDFSNRLFKEWYLSPLNGEPLIRGICSKPNDLDCLCAILTYGKETEKEKSEAIAGYIINRLSYNRGKISQKDIQGLVFGGEREAVCEGYSRVYEAMLKKVGIKAQYVTGAVRTSPYDIFHTIYSHAWNEVLLDGNIYSLDVTWANNTQSNWYLQDPKDMYLTHLITEREGKDDLTCGSSSYYKFLDQPMVYPNERGSSEKISCIDKTEPVQFAEGKFVLNFSSPLMVRNISKEHLVYPFVNFTGESDISKSVVISNSSSLKKSIKTDKVEIILPEKVNYITMDIEGIGTMHYVVFNGTRENFYEFLIKQIQPTNAFSVAMAFLACAKLNDEAAFNDLSLHVYNQDLTFENFMKQANASKTEDFKYALFNTCNTLYYSGDKKTIVFSFEFNSSTQKRPDKIFLDFNKETKIYTFLGIGKEFSDFYR